MVYRRDVSPAINSNALGFQQEPACVVWQFGSSEVEMEFGAENSAGQLYIKSKDVEDPCGEGYD